MRIELSGAVQCGMGIELSGAVQFPNKSFMDHTIFSSRDTKKCLALVEAYSRKIEVAEICKLNWQAGLQLLQTHFGRNRCV